jgi:hypothetical protein
LGIDGIDDGAVLNDTSAVAEGDIIANRRKNLVVEKPKVVLSGHFPAYDLSIYSLLISYQPRQADFFIDIERCP